MKKYWILFILLRTVCTFSFYLWNQNKSKRSPSSVSVDKELVISAIHWKTGESESEISIDLSCSDWSSMEVTLKSEGVAYSGEPSRVVQSSLCGNSIEGFYQIWPHDLKKNYSGIQKIGFYNESPPEWTLEKVKFFGTLGSLEISAIEIYRQTGEILIFEAL